MVANFSLSEVEDRESIKIKGQTVRIAKIRGWGGIAVSVLQYPCPLSP